MNEHSEKQDLKDREKPEELKRQKFRPLERGYYVKIEQQFGQGRLPFDAEPEKRDANAK